MIIPGYAGSVAVILVTITMIDGDHCDDGPGEADGHVRGNRALDA